MAARLTAFDIKTNGNLTNRRLWAKLDGAMPDGICLDSEQGIWVASPSSNEALRIEEGGLVTDRVTLETGACMLGGKTGKTLHILTSGFRSRKMQQERSAKIEVIDVSAQELAGLERP